MLNFRKKNKRPPGPVLPNKGPRILTPIKGYQNAQLASVAVESQKF